MKLTESLTKYVTLAAVICASLALGGCSSDIDTSSPATEETSVSELTPVSQLIAVGDTWDEVYDVLEEAGYKDNDYEVVTDDGKGVWLRSNWSVESIEDASGPAKAQVGLHHVTEADEEPEAEDAEETEGTEDSEENLTTESAEDNTGDTVTSTDPEPTAPATTTPESAAPTPSPTPAPQQLQRSQQPQQQNVYYPNCTAARAAGAAPIYQGQPGYSTKLDRDRDGIACE